MINSAFILMPIPMAWEVVLSENMKHEVGDLLCTAFWGKLSVRILFSVDIKDAFVKTDAHSDTIKKVQKSMSISAESKAV